MAKSAGPGCYQYRYIGPIPTCDACSYMWEKEISLCHRCLASVSNKSYFAGPKGSAHFRGTCALSRLQAPTPQKAEASIIKWQTRKENPSRAAWLRSYGWQEGMEKITDRASFEKFWGFDKINKPKKTRAKKTLQKMGIAA